MNRYGIQMDGRLDDMGSFDKYIGDSPPNIARGTPRIQIDDEHMGRFIQEQLERGAWMRAASKPTPNG